MSLYGFDGASAFDLTAAKRAGGIVCSTYIVGTPGGMPHADAARVAAIRAAGMGALPNWERAPDFFLTCDLAGAEAAGGEALAACRALGYPADGSAAVAFSFDTDVPAGRYAEMAGKLAAVQSGLTGAYRAIAYAEYGLLAYLAAHGQPGPHWLTMSTFGEGDYDPGAPFVAMVQQHRPNGSGGWEWMESPVPGTDINYVTQPAALGAWWPDNSLYAGGLHMDADVQARFDAIDAKLRALADYRYPNGTDVQGTIQGIDHNEIAAALGPLSAKVDALAAQVAKLQPGGQVDYTALAQAIAAHVKLAAQ